MGVAMNIITGGHYERLHGGQGAARNPNKLSGQAQ